MIVATIVPKANDNANSVDVMGAALYYQKGHLPKICSAVTIVSRKYRQKIGAPN